MDNNRFHYQQFALGLMASAMLLSIPVAHADITLGGGIRTSFSSTENAASNGTSDSTDFSLDSVRLYVNGEVTDSFGVTFNTERTSDGEIRVLDGIVRMELSDAMNIWVGRLLPPSDRSNLSGPYYLNNWHFPSVQAYPAIFAGRDDGIAYWGQSGGGKFKWQLGAFEGPATPNDEVLYAGRLTLNLWDPEPGYYNSSTYYGDKDILAVGLTAQGQDDNTAYSIDALMEKKLANSGVISLEAAYYDYEGLGGLGGTKSNGYFAQAAYLFPQKMGSGKAQGQLQPTLRYTEGEVDGGADGEILDVGLNYIVKGHNARVGLAYQDRSGGLFGSDNSITLGLQLQM